MVQQKELSQISANPPNTTTPLSVPVTAGVVGGAKEIFIHVSVRGQMLVPASRALCGS